MTSAENSVSEPSNLEIFWGRISPYPLQAPPAPQLQKKLATALEIHSSPFNPSCFIIQMKPLKNDFCSYHIFYVIPPITFWNFIQEFLQYRRQPIRKRGCGLRVAGCGLRVSDKRVTSLISF